MISDQRSHARGRHRYVITEYGYAYIFCKSIQERALSLIEIAHPSFRKWLLEEGKRLGYIKEYQSLRSKVAYPEEEEREITLKNGKNVLIRPSRAEWQSCGIGSALQQRMTEYAQAKGLRGFKATILAENAKMQNLINKHSQVEMESIGREFLVTVLFET